MQPQPSRKRTPAPHVIERQRQVRGLLLIAAAALAFAVWRAGGLHAFNPGWWRLW
jgi:hypothetical protein